MNCNKKHNKLILEYIEKIVDPEPSAQAYRPVTRVSKSKPYKADDMVLKSTLHELDYSSSNSFLTLAAEKELSALLGSPEEFAKLPNAKRAKLQQQLDQLNKDEYV